MSGMGKPGDEQTWVYDADTDTWYAGAASGGTGGGSFTVVTGSGRINYHDTTYSPVGLWQLSGSLIDLGSQVTNLTVGVGTERYSNMGPGLRGFMFDGSTMLVNTASVPTSMVLTGACTLEMLAIVEPSTSSQALFTLGGLHGDVNGSENCLLQFSITADGALDYFAEFGPGTNIQFIGEQATIPWNQLCHVAMTRSDSNVVRFYVNGSLLQTSTALAQATTGSAPSTARVQIGGANNGSFSSVTTAASKTSIASVKLINRQLTDAELAAEYQRTLGNLYVQTSLVTQSITYNVTNVSASVSPGYQQANYAFVTSSLQWTVPTGSTFVGEPNLTASITTAGDPVFISVNANYTAQSGTPTGIFSIARNGTNLGHPTWGMQVAGPLVNTYNNNVSMTFVDFPPAGTHSYSLIGCNPTGSGLLTAYEVGPAAIMAFEMIGANVVTASTTTQQNIPNGDVPGLSASITPTQGPVLAIASINYSNNSAGNWAWNTIYRNGNNLGSTLGLSLAVGTTAGEMQNMSTMVLDQGATLGATNTYTLRATNGAGSGVIGRNGQLGTLILWELKGSNFKTATSTTNVTLGSGFTDAVPATPTLALKSTGRPVLIGAGLHVNTSATSGRSGWTFLRNGISLASGSKGFQLVDGEGNSDYDKNPTMFWLDTTHNQQANTYQVAGKNVSGSSFTAQGPTLSTFFVYELDAGNVVQAGAWLDTGHKLSTTASVAISNGTENLLDPSLKGQDVYFYVSGTVDQTTSSNPQLARVALFGGDVRISGSLTVGSGSVKVTSNDVQFGGFGTRIEREGDDLKFYDGTNPDGWALSELVGGGGGSGSSAPVNVTYTQTFTYTGTTGSFVVPDGVTELRVKMWGAGGGSGNYGAPSLGAGAGGMTEGTFKVTPGETLYYIIGGGGQGTTGSSGDGGFGGWGGGGFGTKGDASGGGGGGYTGIFSGAIHQQTAIMIAGGGGGGTGYRAGGGGGGTTGRNAPVANGTGGTQSAAGGPTPGGPLYGGNGGGSRTVSTSNDDGGGGGGYFGGGGGTGDGSGGGGGSGYLNTGSLRLAAGSTSQGSDGATAGARSNPAGYLDPDYLSLAPANTATGGGATSGIGQDGGHGFMIIRYTVGNAQAYWHDDNGAGAFITSSVAIGTGTRASNAAGQEAFFFVSGTIAMSGSRAKKSIFGGDVFVSGALSTTPVLYQGYATGSLTWTASTWTDFHTVPLNFTDEIQLGITRNNSTWTVWRDGYYRWHSSANVSIGSGSGYIAWRLSGSNGTLINTQDYTQFADQSIMQGYFFLTSGSSFRFQYVRKGGENSTWVTNDPFDGENARTVNISIERVF